MDISKANCPNCKSRMAITKVVCNTCNIQLEAEFNLPSLSQLSVKEQDFVIAFIHHHGSIKQTGEQLGVSYPTVKSRLTAIAEKLPPKSPVGSHPGPPLAGDVLTRLKEGQITVDQALELLD